jgi:hypothetical protein
MSSPLSLRRLLGRLVAPARAPGRRRSSPHLEVLEGRTVPTVTYRGGALLPSVEVQGVYLGSNWQTNPTLSAQVNYLEGYLSSVVSGTYMDALTNAGYGVGRGSSSAGHVNPVTLATGSTVTDASIRTYINNGIMDGTLAPVDANRLYVVYVQQNVIVNMGGSTSASFRGYHGAYAGPGGDAVRYAVVAYPRGTVNNASVTFLSDIDSITKTSSHEIAEAATDPDVNFRTMGWYDSSGGEIGDINNDRVATLFGYVIQRVIDPTDHNMTPAGASANAAMSFALRSNGQLMKVVNGTATQIATGVASVSDQSIDNMGHVMVDYVTTGGSALEWHDGGSTVTLRAGARAAVATVGASYILGTDGTVYQRDDALGSTTTVTTGAASINAGSDKIGVNLVGIVGTDGSLRTKSDASGMHTLVTSGVATVSVGQQGILSYVTTAGNGYVYSEWQGASYLLDSGLSQVTTGTDEAGGWMLEYVYNDGSAYEYRSSTGSFSAVWTDTFDGTVVTMSKARLGLIDVAFSWGDGWEHTLDGYTTLVNTGNTVTVV